MSFVTTQPQDLPEPTGGPPNPGTATDPASILMAAQVAAHAQMYQEIRAQAAAVHQQFIQMMTMGADAYAASVAANTDAAG